MAYVITRPSSPVQREPFQIPSDTPHSPYTQNLSFSEMVRDKDCKSHLDIQVDSPVISLKGVGVDVEPALLTGHVVLYLTESTSIKEITLHFRGKARISSSDPLTRSNAPLTYVVCTHDWSFLEGEKHRSHTLKAGRHLFPFQLRVGGSLPSSMSTSVLGGASIVYKLRAEAVRSAFSQNLHAVLPIPVIRSFAPEALEYQQSLEIENTWPDKLMYSIMVPHKAWAAGDRMTTIVKFAPLNKGICVLNVTITIVEHIKFHSRISTPEHSRIVAVSKYEIIEGRPVEVRGTRLLRSRSAGRYSPPTPPTPSTQDSPHTDISNSSGVDRSHLSASSSSPSTPPLHLSDPETGPSTSTSNNLDESASSDIVAHIHIDIPTTITPSHNLDPVTVTHRVRWDVLVLNPDGHTSELKCSLPLHLLDYRLLDEARSCTAATRRLLLEGPEEPAEEPAEAQLPSYMAHVRDRVANMFLPEASTLRVRNPWIAQGVSPTFNTEGLSGHSTPFEAHTFSHLPHAPGTSNSPLDWVDSELLLSISRDQRVHADLPHPNSPLDSPSRPHSPQNTRGRASRFSSRSASPDHDREHHTFPQIQTYIHTGNASRLLHGIFNASMKPFSSFSNHWIHNLAISSHSSEVQRPTASRPPYTAVPMGPDPNTGAALLHRAFTEVPDYSIASLGFLGGVPPLSSSSGLPSYEETQRTQIDPVLAV